MHFTDVNTSLWRQSSGNGPRYSKGAELSSLKGAFETEVIADKRAELQRARWAPSTTQQPVNEFQIKIDAARREVICID